MNSPSNKSDGTVMQRGLGGDDNASVISYGTDFQRMDDNASVISKDSSTMMQRVGHNGSTYSKNTDTSMIRVEMTDDNEMFDKDIKSPLNLNKKNL